ncbi:MAG: phage holin family protein [Puniceicoccales bacterium]
MSEKPSKGGSLGGSIFLGLFGSFFAGMGIFAIVSTARGQLSGDDPEWAGYLMGGLFTLIGLGIIYAGIASLRHGKKAIEHPDEPWLLKKDWAEGRISDSNRIGFFFMAGFALIWNAISWTATIGVYQEGSDAEPVAYWVVLLFPLVGLGLIGVTIYQFLRWRKYGQSVFEMAEVPGVIGGSLGGLVLTSTDVKPAKGFQVTLVNQKEVTSGSGKNRSTHTTTIWESEQWIHEDALPDDHQRTALPIFFAIPYSCEPTADLGRTDYKWELRVKAEMPGVDYEARFSVPVYKTKDSDPSFDARAARAVSNNEAAPPPAIDWSKGGFKLHRQLSFGGSSERQ